MLKISEYFDIPAVEQLITNRRDRLPNRYRCRVNYVCQALVMSFEFVSLFLVMLFICIY